LRKRERKSGPKEPIPGKRSCYCGGHNSLKPPHLSKSHGPGVGGREVRRRSTKIHLKHIVSLPSRRGKSRKRNQIDGSAGRCSRGSIK